MTRSAATIDIRPAAGQYVDLEASAGTLPPDAWIASRNVQHRDDGTPERRDGFYSYHGRMDAAGSPIMTEPDPPSEFPILGLHQFTRFRNTQRYPKSYFVAKIGQYLMGSRYGNDFTETPLVKGLGTNSIPDFTEFYRDADLRNYLIVMTDDPDFSPRYWGGEHSQWGTGSGHTAKWDFFTEIPGLPSGRFATTHNGRLYVASQEGTLIYYSVAGDFLDFSGIGSGQLALDPTFGRVTGFFPTYYGELVIGQEQAIQRLSFSSGIPAALAPITTELGLINNRSVAQIGQDLVFFSTKGKLHSLATTDRFGDLVQGELTQTVIERFDLLPRSTWRAVFLVDDPTDQRLLIGHPIGSGTRNDRLTAWDYRRNRFLAPENRSIGGFGCGAVLTTARWQRPKAHLGSYATATQDSGTHGTGGRVFTFHRGHKEDIFFESSAVSAVATAPLHLAPQATVPRNGGFGGSTLLPSQINPTGTYQDAGATAARIRVRALHTGTIGTTATLNLELEDRHAGQTGQVLQSVGSAYTPGTPFNLETATYDTGFDIELPAIAVTAGEEFVIATHRGQRLDETFSSDLRDLTDNLQFSDLIAKETFAYNMVPFVETAGLYVGDPNNTIHLLGLTVVTRVIGNRADTQTAGDDQHAGQNQFRWSLDCYARFDEGLDWQQLALLDGNAAKRHHIGASQGELTDQWGSERGDLRYTLSPDGTAANGTPIGRKTDVNVEYVPIDKFCKVFWMRFGQETMSCLDHTDAGGENTLAGIRHGDFNIVAIHVHWEPAASESLMDQASSTIRGDLEAVTR